MTRHVEQGSLERFTDSIGGVPALGFSWTDGILDIATWFVAPSASAVVRVDHSVTPPTSAPTREMNVRVDGGTLLASIAWS